MACTTARVETKVDSGVQGTPLPQWGPNWGRPSLSAPDFPDMQAGAPVVGQPVGRRPPVAQGVQNGVVVAHAVQAAPAPPAAHRLNHLKLHITQAALAVDEISNEDVLAMARTKGELVEYSIGDEIHPQPADPNRPRHKHYYLKYRTAINHRDSRFCTIFDMRGAHGRVLHPHIQGVGPKIEDRVNVIYYSQKDKLYIASPHLMNFDFEASRSAAWAIEMNRAESVREGMISLQQRHPETFYLHHAQVEAGLTMRIGISEPPQYSLADFNVPPLNLRLAVVLQGAAHIGKTQFALAHFRYPLLVSELDDIKLIGLRTDGIVFDQMRFNERARDGIKGCVNMNADQIIRLLDIELSRSIGGRYKNGRIPRNMPRIFTTNRNLTAGQHIFPVADDPATQEGIDSRLLIMPWMANDLRNNPGPNARGALQPGAPGP